MESQVVEQEVIYQPDSPSVTISRSLKQDRSQAIFTAGFLRLVRRFAEHICLASLPAMALFFNVPKHMLQLSMVCFVAGVALSQFWGGSFAEQNGLKRSLYLFSITYILGSALILASGSIGAVIVGRFIQGAGVGMLMVIGNVFIHDVYSSASDSGKIKAVAKPLAYVGVISAWFPAFAIFLSGYLQLWYGWRFNFIIQMLLGFMVLGLAYLFNFNEQIQHKKLPSVIDSIKSYCSYLRNREYRTHLLSYVILNGGIAVYFIMYVFILDNMGYRLPMYLTYASLMPVAGYSLGKMLCSPAGHFFDEKKIFKLGFGLAIVSSLVFLLLTSIYKMHPFINILPVLTYSAAVGLLNPYVNAKLMALYPEHRVSANSLLFIFVSIISVVFGLVASIFSVTSFLSMAFFLVLISICAYFLYLGTPCLSHQK